MTRRLADLAWAAVARAAPALLTLLLAARVTWWVTHPARPRRWP